MLARYAALHHDAYYSSEISALERGRIFDSAWLYAGIAGDFSTEPRVIETAGRMIAISCRGDVWQGNTSDKRVAIERCGNLIFYSLAATPPTLASHLAPFFEILRTMSEKVTGSDQRLSQTIQANWKIMAENALDDYHTATVHPTTLYPSMLNQGERRIELTRAGGHSLWRNLLNESDAAFWAKLALRLGDRRGDRPTDYQHLFIFPNFYLANFQDTALILHRLNPIGADVVSLDMEFCIPLAFGTRAQEALKRAALADFVAKADAILREDIDVCEAAHRGRAFAVRPSLLGAREHRIGDFQDVIRAHLACSEGHDAE